MNTPEHLEIIDVLLVEDDPGDVLLIEEAFADNKVRNRLHTVSDGVEALQFLRREGPYADAPQPDLVLLDLNLPRMDGREVLGEIRRDPHLAHLPVVIVTTSAAPRDIDFAYAHRANAYVRKPNGFHALAAVATALVVPAAISVLTLNNSSQQSGKLQLNSRNHGSQTRGTSTTRPTLTRRGSDRWCIGGCIRGS